MILVREIGGYTDQLCTHLVQAMFRAMYQHDLTEPDAFDLWKDDESEENSMGKMKAVIQTMDWFTWMRRMTRKRKKRRGE